MRISSASTLVHLVSLSALAVAALVVADHQPAQAAPAAAAPGTLVFIKDSNVWVSRTDGTGARRITTDGTAAHRYLSPSQADTGEIVVSHDERIIRMDAFGHVLNVIDPPALTNSAGHDMDGTPSSVALSPDGTTIAYTQVDQSCPPGVPCGARFATAYTAADHLTSPATSGTTFGNDPSWIGNDRTVQGGGAIPDVRVHVLGQPSPPRWFVDSQIESPGEELTDPTVSRDQRWVAAIRGWGVDTNLIWARTAGDLVSAPRLWCDTGVEPIAEPAFSADSRTLAWATNEGIWMEHDIAGCGDPTLVVEGASEPSFSAARFTTRDTHAEAPSNVTAPSIGGVARSGRTLTARKGSWRNATSYAYQWLRNGRPIARATGATYTVPATMVGKDLSVQVIATGPGGTTAAVSPAVRVAS